MAPTRRLALLFVSALTLPTTACHRPTTVAGGTSATSTASTGGALDASPDVHETVTERVAIHTSDGWTLTADLTRGMATYPVLLVHQLSSNRHEWAPLLERLHAEPRVATLAIDVRGHGESTQGPDGTTNWQSFGSDSARWAGIARDVDAAVRYLHDQFHEMRGVVAIGSSIGSTGVIREAADDPSVVAVVLLSPGIEYRGLDTLQPMTRFLGSHRPFLAIASEGDTASAEAVRRFGALASPATTSSTSSSDASSAVPVDAAVAVAARRDAGRSLGSTEIFGGTGAHGVSIGAPGVHPELWTRIDAWVRDAIRNAGTTTAP